MNHNTALKLSASRELREYLMQNATARDEIVMRKSPINSAYGLPSVLYNYNVIVENVFYNAYNRGGVGATGTVVVPDNKILVFLADGPQETADAMVASLENAGATIVAQGDVQQAKGGTQVDAAFVNGEWVACDTIIANIPPTPRVELFQQAGCELGWARGVLEPKVDREGRTTVPGIRALRAKLEVAA